MVDWSKPRFTRCYNYHGLIFIEWIRLPIKNSVDGPQCAEKMVGELNGLKVWEPHTCQKKN
jgi:hypothetical protein